MTKNGVIYCPAEKEEFCKLYLDSINYLREKLDDTKLREGNLKVEIVGKNSRKTYQSVLDCIYEEYGGMYAKAVINKTAYKIGREFAREREEVHEQEEVKPEMVSIYRLNFREWDQERKKVTVEILHGDEEKDKVYSVCKPLLKGFFMERFRSQADFTIIERNKNSCKVKLKEKRERFPEMFQYM